MSREWLEKNPGKKLPNDYSQFPGHLDHASCLCIRVGRYSHRAVQHAIDLWDYDVPEEGIDKAAFPALFNEALPVRVCVTEAGVDVQCAVLSRSSLEVFEDETHVFLTLTPNERAKQQAQELVGKGLLTPQSELLRPIERTVRLPCKIQPGSTHTVLYGS